MVTIQSAKIVPIVKKLDSSLQLPGYAVVLLRLTEDGVDMEHLDQLQQDFEKLLFTTARRCTLLKSEIECLDEDEEKQSSQEVNVMDDQLLKCGRGRGILKKIKKQVKINISKKNGLNAIVDTFTVPLRQQFVASLLEEKQSPVFCVSTSNHNRNRPYLRKILEKELFKEEVLDDDGVPINFKELKALKFSAEQDPCRQNVRDSLQEVDEKVIEMYKAMKGKVLGRMIEPETAVQVAIAFTPQLLVVISTSIWIFDQSSDWPFGVFPNGFNRNFVIFFQTFMYCLISNGYFIFQVSYFSILAHVQIHLRNLNKQINRIIHDSARDCFGVNTDSDKIMNENIPWKYLEKRLQSAILYHVAIISVSKKIEKTFRMSNLTVFLILTIIICLLVFQISLIEPSSSVFWIDVSYILPLTSLLVMNCYNGNEIIIKSEQIGNACYNLNFVGTDIRFQKSLVFMIQRSQKPIVFTVGKFASLSLMTALSAARAGYSYFMLLRRMTQE
ncbi:hypothetical protein FQA39_LY10771 [Lamprigera yunnana]|nr:hypothetical protein FQA39_LY10771 [Lamprigera yunnana]